MEGFKDVCPKCRSEFQDGYSYCNRCEEDLVETLSDYSIPDTIKPPASISDKASTIEVRQAEDQIIGYENSQSFHQAILDGKLQRGQEARTITHDKTGAKTGKWISVEKLAGREFRIQSLYKPIWAHTIRGLLIGWFVGFILKALDSAVLYFQINTTTALLWSVFIGATILSFVPKMQKAGSVVMITGLIAIFTGNGNLWLGALSVGIVSLLAAAPFGMVIGTIVGHIRRPGLPKAFDAVPEGIKPYLFGIVLPLLFAVIFIPVYLFVLNPMLINWLNAS